ncbi:MAG TPA: hypothetical protein RWN64_06860, partial [Ruminococcus sp.]
MEKFVIRGGRRLTGEVEISGAKNAAVAIIPAVILSDEPCVIENVPAISDVNICLRILREMGADVQNLSRTSYKIDATKIQKFCVPYETARKMRASYYFLGALLGKFGKARVSMPGGCPLGDRPIDQHLKGFRAKVKVKLIPDQHNFSRKDLETIVKRFNETDGQRNYIVT